MNGVKNVIHAVKQMPTIKKLIYVSSFFALGPSDGNVVNESQVKCHCFSSTYKSIVFLINPKPF